MAGPVAGHVLTHHGQRLNPVRCTPGNEGGSLRLSRRILEERTMTIPARYENGVFRPLQDAPIKEGTVVEVHVPVEASAMRPRSIGDSPFAGMWKAVKTWPTASNT